MAREYRSCPAQGNIGVAEARLFWYNNGCMIFVRETSNDYAVTLERLYQRYNHRECVGLDPLAFLYKYDNPRDVEIVGFLAAGLAYGRVEQITKSLGELLGRMGKSPHEFTMEAGKKQREKLAGFKHRFNTGEDVADLLAVFRGMLEKSGSIEKFFLEGLGEEDESVLPAIESFCSRAIGMHGRIKGKEMGAGLRYLLTRPSGGSPCKRLNLFLRWMVRKDEVDVGIWKGVDKAKLIVPVDVHIDRLSRILGLHTSKNVTLKTAVEITRAFAVAQPKDPAKYDFALSRVGILEGCTGKPGEFCERCELAGYCQKKFTTDKL
jgi:uncharacterized protein (TIGR02757 family)